MSRFYGKVEGQASTCATRRGSAFIKTSAQSWDGSVITELENDENDNLIVKVGVANGSKSYVDTWLFKGSIEELEKKLKA